MLIIPIKVCPTDQPTIKMLGAIFLRLSLDISLMYTILETENPPNPKLMQNAKNANDPMLKLKYPKMANIVAINIIRVMVLILPCFCISNPLHSTPKQSPNLKMQFVNDTQLLLGEHTKSYSSVMFLSLSVVSNLYLYNPEQA